MGVFIEMSVRSVVMFLLNIRHIFVILILLLLFSLSLLQKLVLSLSAALLLLSFLISVLLASFFVLCELILGGLVVSLLILGCKLVLMAPFLLKVLLSVFMQLAGLVSLSPLKILLMTKKLIGLLVIFLLLGKRVLLPFELTSPLVLLTLFFTLFRRHLAGGLLSCLPRSVSLLMLFSLFFGLHEVILSTLTLPHDLVANALLSRI